MRKEIIVCDECGKMLEKEERQSFCFEHWFFDLCNECYEKKDGVKEAFSNLYSNYDKKRKALLKKYSLDKLINR